MQHDTAASRLAPRDGDANLAGDSGAHAFSY
jgi:hypothetical protein